MSPTGVLKPADMESPAFLVAPPLSLAGDVPNNVYMMELSDEERAVDRSKAIRQFAKFVEALSADGCTRVRAALPAAAAGPVLHQQRRHRAAAPS